ncbi:alpha-L-fucosidase [Algoriphagus sp. D3-2-R+10]|uniref:alpha-L-fucosidase n=1 Tax=Algoriphagus aurantiacus TaxID=3103948 RepID=UPI002B3C244F|nr:alpha-L-fucosidase [Algoriphagus sp. D3-2-R+10]MEB2775355.1 alpha-L-fucosidase [Algoriphagus sp. D3-2-R+10]
MYLLKSIFLSVLVVVVSSCEEVKPPEPVGPLPSENQMAWQDLEYYAFVHFSVNTYTDMSWGFGDEDPAIFNPEKLDVRQWARIAKEAGMKGIILTAKHHSGFCLWPSEYTDYTIANSPCKDGKGDIVREMAEACKEYGLKLGIYLSPWDRNYAEYGSPEYITYFRNQLTELLTNYGEIFEVWFDGAHGGSGYYGGANETRTIDRSTYYDWQNTYDLVRKLQPNIVIWNDGGVRADLRWVGTEAGYVGETNWSLLNATGDVPEDMLRHGVEDGDSWVPAEVNTSIRPEWFYHPKEDDKVKTLPELMNTYYHSIGRNGTLLLNFPIMPNGLIHEKDEKAVLEFANAVKEVFDENLVENAETEASNVRGNSSTFSADKAIDTNTDSYWTTDDGVSTGSLTITFDKSTSFNRFLVQEYIRLGQRVKTFTLEALIDGNWEELASETTIGYKRILRFPTVEATKIRLNITDSKSSPLISTVGVYHAPQILTAPIINRNQFGEVIITPGDSESEIYYTLDGVEPTSTSSKYTEPFSTDDGKILVKAVAYNSNTGKSSPITEEKFDISKKNWKVVGVEDGEVNKVIDGNTGSSWYQDKESNLPKSIVIDLGKEQNLIGFSYLPDQNWWGDGIITDYRFYVSQNGSQWRLVNQGEFSNIKNNPLKQVKSFKSEKARYIKLEALRNTNNNNTVGYAEIDVITQ